MKSLPALLFIFFSMVLSAQAEIVLWSPAGQNAIYVLPEGVTPEKYLQNLKNDQSLSSFTASMNYTSFDHIQTIRPVVSGSADRALLVANQAQDHELRHPRVDNFGRHFNQTFVIPVGATLNLSERQEEKFYRELGQHFGLFVFMGGDDKDPSLYGEEKTWSENTNWRRDALEMRLIQYVYNKTERKIFGVCRGLQQVFTTLGGKLNQDVKKDLRVHEEHKGGTFHSLIFSKTKHQTLERILSQLPQNHVDSHHHQSAREDSVKGTIFETSARSPEGVIEALESRDQRILLVQFHPEMADNMNSFTRGFFKQLKVWQKVSSPRACYTLF